MKIQYSLDKEERREWISDEEKNNCNSIMSGVWSADSN